MAIDKKKIQAAGDLVEREVTTIMSKQPRFNPNVEPDKFLNSVVQWVRYADLEEPAYQPNSMRRDQWLRKFWPKEPHLGGVIHQVTSIDANRGWSLIGGRNQVALYQTIIHNFNPKIVHSGRDVVLGDGDGWRFGVSQQSESYYTSDMGAVTEIGREGESGPMRALWHVDSARTRLTGDPDNPIEYHPDMGKPQLWGNQDFFRATSMPSTDERYHGLGYSAVSRALEMAKLMIAVYRHDQEQLGARAPRGLLLLQNISEEQWRTALQARDQEVSSLGRQYFGGVMVLASEGVDQMDAKLVALSRLPDKFDIKITTDLLLWAYALVFGYDATEFWPVSAGVIGRGKETDIQHRKATGKGGLNFILSYQEQLQAELPDTVHFVFEQRDAEGELLDAELKKSQVEFIAKLYETGLKEEKPLLSRDEARSLLAEYGIIDPALTVVEEDLRVTDLDREGGPRRRALLEKMLNQERVIRAIERYPDEPIVRYIYDPVRERGRVETLWKTGREAYSHYYRLNRMSLPEVNVEVKKSIDRPSTRNVKKPTNAEKDTVIIERLLPKVVKIEDNLTVNGRNTPVLEN